MSTNIGIRLALFNLYGGVPDADGDRFWISDIEGLGSPTVTLNTTDRHGEGSSLNNIKASHREILIKGSGVAPSNIDQGSARIREKIQDAFGPYTRGPQFTYLDFPQSRRSYYLYAYAGGQLHFPTPRFNYQEFEIPLRADDPRLYGQTIKGNASVTGFLSAVNAGNYPTPLRAILNNNATNPWIERDGQRITLPGAIAAGTEVDFYNRRTIAPGGNITDLAAVPRTWWSLAPGANNILVSGNWNLSWRDGYW